MAVQIRYGRNDDPKRWGYDLLALDFDIDAARGFPVIEARVEYPAEGYAAVMSWIQSSGTGSDRRKSRL